MRIQLYRDINYKGFAQNSLLNMPVLKFEQIILCKHITFDGKRKQKKNPTKQWWRCVACFIIEKFVMINTFKTQRKKVQMCWNWCFRINDAFDLLNKQKNEIVYGIHENKYFFFVLFFIHVLIRKSLHNGMKIYVRGISNTRKSKPIYTHIIRNFQTSAINYLRCRHRKCASHILNIVLSDNFHVALIEASLFFHWIYELTSNNKTKWKKFI